MARIAAKQGWLAERVTLLAREKEFDRLRDELAAARRDLPWVKLDQDYRFDGDRGQLSFAELFVPG